jgi:hypothetical protein
VIEYRIDSPRRLIIVTGGYATPEEWTALLARLIADPERRPGFGYLRDLRSVPGDANVDAVKAVVAVFRQVWPQLELSRAALVTGAAIGAAAVAQVLATEQEMPLEAFTSYADAVDWLRDGT